MIPTQALKYGWIALATLTVGGPTIFVVNNQMNRITTQTRIEIILAMVERCFATQTGTNADGTPIYAVAPPIIVRTWTDTNGVSVIVTNALEWRDDLSMKINLDNKLFSLIPRFADTNTVYNGSTNVSMLTVTGLFADLQIGDKTNQFTAIPAIGTNPAVFGPWAWRNYVVAWQERYKVLNALKMTRRLMGAVATNYAYRAGLNTGSYAQVSAVWLAASWTPGSSPYLSTPYHIAGEVDYDPISPNSMVRNRGQANLTFGYTTTQLVVNSYAIDFTIAKVEVSYSVFCTNDIYGAYGLCIKVAAGSPPASYTTEMLGDSAVLVPDRPGHPAGFWIYNWVVDGFYESFDWQFSYCTNKFW